MSTVTVSINTNLPPPASRLHISSPPRIPAHRTITREARIRLGSRRRCGARSGSGSGSGYIRAAVGADIDIEPEALALGAICASGWVVSTHIDGDSRYSGRRLREGTRGGRDAYLGGLPAQRRQVSTVRPFVHERWFGSKERVDVGGVFPCAIGVGIRRISKNMYWWRVVIGEAV
jgi:hypothetical protein